MDNISHRFLFVKIKPSATNHFIAFSIFCQQQKKPDPHLAFLPINPCPRFNKHFNVAAILKPYLKNSRTISSRFALTNYLSPITC
jgi:hypothetical protein